jgi:hypothetical protein
MGDGRGQFEPSPALLLVGATVMAHFRMHICAPACALPPSRAPANAGSINRDGEFRSEAGIWRQLLKTQAAQCGGSPFRARAEDRGGQASSAAVRWDQRAGTLSARVTDRRPARGSDRHPQRHRSSPVPSVTQLRPVPGTDVAHPAPSRTGTSLAAAGDRSGTWLGVAMVGLGLLASAAATVSYTAQYRMVLGERHQFLAAGLEAAIPDAGALVFASLGIALALHGRRAVRARTLNVAAVGASVVMNVLAASPGWKGVAIWAMPPVAYALASDTMIGVVRARAMARQRALASRLADDDPTPLALAGAGLLWLLRLAFAPLSTAAGFRSWVLETPAAPGRRHLAIAAQAGRPELPPGQPHVSGPRPGTKTARFLALVTEHHGPLAGIEPGRVSPICSQLAPVAGLDTGAARTALRKAVLHARDGGSR